MKQITEFVKSVESSKLLEIIYDYEEYKRHRIVKDTGLLQITNEFLKSMGNPPDFGINYWYDEMYIAALKETIERANTVIKKLEQKVFHGNSCSCVK